MLPKARRLTADRDFKKVFAHGRGARGEHVAVKILKNNKPLSRFGVVVSNKVAKKAVVRNRLKRQLRAIIYKNIKPVKPGLDIIVVARPSAVGQTYQVLTDEISALLSQTKAV